MLSTPRQPRTALSIFALFTALLIAACSASSDPRSEPTASATRSSTPEASASPAPTATPRAPFLGETTAASTDPDLARSRALLDEVIAAVTARDIDALEALLELQQVACSGKSGRGPTEPPFPGCDGAPAKSLVPAFPAGVCNSVWHRDPRPILERFVERAGDLYAVMEGPGSFPEYGMIDAIDSPSTWDYRIVFTASLAGTPVGYTVVLAGGRIVSLALGCGPLTNSTLWWQDPAPEVIRKAADYVEPTPFPTPQPPTSVDPATVPRGDRTGDPLIDRVIDALATHDPEVIRTVIHTTREQCSSGFALSGPRCAEGDLEATVVDSFFGAACEGSFGIADVDAIAREFAGLDLILYAVNAPDPDGSGGALVYDAGPTASSGRMFPLDRGAIAGTITYACTSPAEIAQWSPLLLRGPAWPEDGAAAE